MKRIAWWMVLPLAPLSVVGQNNIDRELEEGPDGEVSVVVQFKKQPGDKHHGLATRRGGRLSRQHGRSLAASYRIPKSALKDLANDPDVQYVAVDRPISASLDSTAFAVNASYAWNNLGLNGKGVGIAFIDSGFTYSWDLNCVDQSRDRAVPCPSRIVYSQDFTGSTASAWDENDGYGHAVHVMGIAAGNGNYTSTQIWPGATRRVQGIAPAANLISLRALNSSGQGTDSSVIAAINRAIELKSTYNIRVLNLSLGRPVYTSYRNDPLCQAVEAAWKAGIVVVVAAGNNGRDNSKSTNGYGTITAPGNDPYVITVGAVNGQGTAQRSDDIIASYSSKGPTMIDRVVKPDIVAPGNKLVSNGAIRSNDPNSSYYLKTNYPAVTIPNSYFESGVPGNSTLIRLSGTSMAAPVVSGAAALLLQKYPALTPDQVKGAMMKSAYKTFPATSSTTDPVTGVVYTAQSDVFTIGAGMLDIQALLSMSWFPAAGKSALSPTVVYDSVTKKVFLNTSGTNIVWGDSAFASNIVWGTNQFVSGTNLVWGSNMVWGTSTLTGFNIIWGTTSPWAASTSQVLSQSILVNGDR